MELTFLLKEMVRLTQIAELNQSKSTRNHKFNSETANPYNFHSIEQLFKELSNIKHYPDNNITV